jgi:ubiquinol-cytochrome c reductase cytochrome c subunit
VSTRGPAPLTASRSERRGPGRLVAGWAAALGLAVLAIVLASPAGASGRPDGPALPAAQVREQGAALYLQNCASCHGTGGEGTELGPSLIGVGAASADFYLRTGRMPLGAPDQRPIRQQPVYTDEQIRALIDVVAGFGPGPEIPQVHAGGDIRRGWELYQANCAACHAASGTGNAVGGGAVAVGLGHATDTQVAEAMLIGPGVMPRFEFDPDDRDAIVAYVHFLRTAPNPGGAPIGGFGPVAEGFVSVVIGSILVLLAVRFVGRRSHEGEPGGPGLDTTVAAGDSEGRG